MRRALLLGSLTMLAVACARGEDMGRRGDAGTVECDGGRCSLPPDLDRDGFRSDVDCDDTEPVIGRTYERACTGECGGGLERCSNGTWAPCDAPTDCACTGDDTRDIACEMCGLQRQQCEGGSWAAVGSCTRQGVCAPGAVEMGDDCGACGFERRTCSEGCSWSDWECVEVPERCSFWVLPSGGTAWTGSRLPESPFAPASAIRAAIPLDGTSDALVLTDTTYHVLRRTCVPRSTECWIESGPRDRWFPQASGQALLIAIDLPAAYFGGARQGIDLLTPTTTYRYTRDLATGAITFDAMGPADVWTGAAPPVRSEMRSAFTDVGNVDGWVDAPCGTPPHVPTAYIAHVQASQVHVFAPDEGCGFYHAEPYATFTPFALPGAPPIERVAASFARSGLFVLAEAP